MDQRGARFVAIGRRIRLSSLLLTGLQSEEVELPGIEQVRRRYPLQRGEHRIEPSRETCVPVAHHLLDDLALQLVLRAAQVAWNDRKGSLGCISVEIGFPAVSKWTDNNVPPVIG